MDSTTNPGGARTARRPSQRPRHYADSIVVKVNKVIADLVPGYLEARRNELEEIWERIGQADLDTLRVIGHRLRGSGEGYGFREITLLGAQIEDAAQAGQLHVVREAAARLEEYVAVVSYVPDE